MESGLHRSAAPRPVAASIDEVVLRQMGPGKETIDHNHSTPTLYLRRLLRASV